MSQRSVRKKRHRRTICRFDGIEFTEIADGVFVYDETHPVSTFEELRRQTNAVAVATVAVLAVADV
jgi:hypothetical protein